jgi:glycosyltransferase involved in cell wall biosynthesis
MLAAQGDAVITMDADLQDDPKVIDTMVRKFQLGKEIVFGVRNDRSVDSRLKRYTATMYYALLGRLGVQLVPGHADFRLVGRRALEALRAHPEANLFLRGLISELGFETGQVRYALRARTQGESKYTWSKMLGLSLNGITSFSAVPLRLIAGLGLLIFLVSLGLVTYALTVKLFLNEAVPGWASTTVPLYALGGLQLLSMGVVGEYIAKIFIETKRRPHSIVAERIDPSEHQTRAPSSAYTVPAADQLV